jgi:dihydrodipicolinate reductase
MPATAVRTKQFVAWMQWVRSHADDDMREMGLRRSGARGPTKAENLGHQSVRLGSYGGHHLCSTAAESRLEKSFKNSSMFT